MGRISDAGPRADDVRKFESAADVARASADFVAEMLRDVVREKGRCTVALSGGSTPRATYELLAAPSVSGEIDWHRVEFFFGDERMVPPDDAGSNYRMARQALFDRISMPSANVHRIPGELGEAEAARRYTAELGSSPLDLVFLGMGDDGHVASLFPGSRALEVLTTAVVPSQAPVPPHSRVTVTMPVINAASRVLLLVTGSGKAERLKTVFAERRSGKPVLPAARVRPEKSASLWFVDAAAAALLDSEPPT
jgi:6-phosphogluconolactonase